MTGASGAQYGIRLLECLVTSGARVYFMVSRAAQVVLETEASIRLYGSEESIQHQLEQLTGANKDQIKVFSQEDWMAPVASGSGAPGKMVICPCSAGTLSSIAYGASNNLIERAADVALKERRKLIIVPRESPLSEIHLENMLRLTRMGAVILPASPGFYNKPESVNDLVDFVVARILGQLGIEQTLMPSWGADCS
ncbi:UbiX family flavin prenyltransferase [Endozoicomonas sp. Mp262]|uniref:flavin prenyltransferase UbiX n=1 Tax=Endozoicomonas sp. Mp262 TaxID=2919499 RepID=UPI0021E00801